MLNLLNIDKLSNQCNVRLLNIIDNPAWCLETVQIIYVDIVFVLTSPPPPPPPPPPPTPTSTPPTETWCDGLMKGLGL